MLSKLSIRNAKRSIKDYAIYLITVILAFSFIFAFNLISQSKDVLNLCSVMSNFKTVMYFISIFIVLIICFLINYTTKFIFQKRSKEFGIYMILGIKKKEITKIFVLENLVLGFFALIIAIPIGIVLSTFMSFIIMSIFEFPYQIKMQFNLFSVLLTFIYFIIIYLIVLFLAKRRITKMKVYDLLYFDKQNEKKKINNKILRNFGFIISLILGILALFLFDRQFNAIGSEPSLKVIFISLLLIIISIYGITFTLSDFILNFVLKRKKIKYNKDNLFVIRTFTSKVKTMNFTLGTLTLLITLSLIALNLSSMFKGMFEYQIELSAPYDISIKDDKEKFQEYIELTEEHYTIDELFTYTTYKNWSKGITNVIAQKYQGWLDYEQVIKLSDYNMLLKLKGSDQVALDDDEYLLHSNREFSDILKNETKIETIELSNGIKLNQKTLTSEDYTYVWGLGSGYIIVVPDRAVENLESAGEALIMNTKEKTTEQFTKKVMKLSSPDMCQENDQGYTTCYQLANITVRGQEEANNNGFLTMSSFVFFYIAFIFTAVVGTILAIQSLSDSTKYKYRYTVLRKLGINDQKLHKTILKQLIIYFGIPLIYPIIISLITITSMNKIFKILLTTDLTYLIYFISNLFIFLLIYVIYFVTTYFGFKKNIEEN